jgi:putative transposase
MEHAVTTMCRVLKVERSGFYAWLRRPVSTRAKQDASLLSMIRESWVASGEVYGSPRVFRDLRELDVRCGQKRIARLMRQAKYRALRRYRRPRYVAGPASVAAPNRLQRQFTTPAPDVVWVTDITYIATFEGWLYLAVVIDLYSRRVIGWSMQPTLARGIVMEALLMAVWRRRPSQRVVVHSDQGSQYKSDDWTRFCKDHQLDPSMSRRGNCWDNAVAESFFSSLKKERIRNRVYPTRAEGRTDVFDYIEVFYNRTRRHQHLGGVSPVQFEEAKSGSNTVYRSG